MIWYGAKVEMDVSLRESLVSDMIFQYQSSVSKVYN